MYSRYNPVFTAILYSTLYTPSSCRAIQRHRRMETTVAEFLTRQSLSTYIDRSICCRRRDAKGNLRGMRCGSVFGRIGEDRCACGLCTELLRCMHGACIMCTALHATACVRKFVPKKISNAPSDNFLHTHMQIMTSSQIALSSSANAKTARIQAPGKSSAARLSARGRVSYRQI